MAGPKMTVEGEREVIRAFDKLSGDMENLSDANEKVGQALIGDVRNRTRQKTGTLAQGWIAEAEATGAKFSNEVSYAVVQEFGGRYIDATNAVAQAYEGNHDAIVAAYSDGVRKRAKRAGIRTD